MPTNDDRPRRRRLVRFPLPPVSGLDVGVAAVTGVVGGAAATGRRLVSLGEQILEGMHKVDAAVSAAQELTAAAHDLRAAAEPLGAAAEPLQGVAERLGRVAERFPGAGRSRG